MSHLSLRSGFVALNVGVSVWAAGPRDELIVIEPTHVGGRRLIAPDDPMNGRYEIDRSGPDIDVGVKSGKLRA